jgi:hypothetical protein
MALAGSTVASAASAFLGSRAVIIFYIDLSIVVSVFGYESAILILLLNGVPYTTPKFDFIQDPCFSNFSGKVWGAKSLVSMSLPYLPFMVNNKLVKSDPSKLKVLKGKGWVITSKICVAPCDEADALPMSFFADYEGLPSILLTIVSILFLFEGGAFDFECEDSSAPTLVTFNHFLCFFDHFLPLSLLFNQFYNFSFHKTNCPFPLDPSVSFFRYLQIIWVVKP